MTACCPLVNIEAEAGLIVRHKITSTVIETIVTRVFIEFPTCCHVGLGLRWGSAIPRRARRARSKVWGTPNLGRFRTCCSTRGRLRLRLPSQSSRKLAELTEQRGV